jgi:MFS family permease
MLIGIGLGVIAAATGVNAIIFYSTQVFAFAGFDEAILATASVGAVNLLATALATYLVDVMGRKQLLEAGTALMTVSLLVLALVLLVFDFSEQLQGVLAVVAVLVYVVGFAIGIGAVMWVMMCEIMDQRVRSKAFGLFISINWGINLIIGLLTLSAIDGLGGVKSDMDDDEQSDAEKKGVAFLFVIFGGICFLSQVFIRFYVPETKGKTPTDFVLCSESSIFDSLGSLQFQNGNINKNNCCSSSGESGDDSPIPDSVPLLS